MSKQPENKTGNSQSSEMNNSEGIFVRGIISSRSRKYFEGAGKYRYCYNFTCNGLIKVVYSWDETHEYLCGIFTEVPVNINYYADKKGEIHIQLTIVGEVGGFGEEEF